MKIQVRTVNSQVKYDLQVESTLTVDKLKDLIEEKHQHPKAQQVLIFSGKILSGEQTLESYNIKENDFLVLMIKKPAATATAKPATSSAQPTSTAQPPSQPQTQPQPQSQPQTQPPVQTQTQPTTQPTTSAPTTQPSGESLLSQSASAFVTGPELQAMVESISAMGFPRDQVLLALRAGFGNPDRALDYLLNGIPENRLPQQPAPSGGANRPQQQGAQQGNPPRTQATRPSGPATPSTPSTPSSTGGSGIFTGGVELPVNLLPAHLLRTLPRSAPPSFQLPGGGGQGGLTGNPLIEYLRRHPSFPQILQVAQNNPERLEEVIGNLIQTNPELLQIIQQNQGELNSLFGAPAPSGGAGGAGGGAGGIQLQLTPQDQEAIDRLTSLGFPRESALQAYFTFEKDEQLAANFLLSYENDDLMDDFEDGDPDTDEM